MHGHGQCAVARRRLEPAASVGAHLKWQAVHDAEHDTPRSGCRAAPALAHDRPRHRHVGAGHAAAEGVGQQFLREVRSKTSDRSSSAFRRPSRPVELRSRPSARPTGSTRSPLSNSRARADGIEALEREADRVHRRVAGRARRVGAMLLQSRPQRHRLRVFGILRQRRHIRRRLRRRSAEQVVQDPLAAQHRRGPRRKRRTVRMLACPSSPRRVRRSTGDRRNRLPTTFGMP